ncbi:MAG TPA: PfkB family carbohydrate kinase [Jatrophihabitans sp.]|nr:PfkB family carbohydrate kinase [Jatrophihabitans sp.]
MRETDFDVVLQGTVYFDVVLTGLPALPVQGTEVLAEGMGSCPGGVANLAVAASRLGLRTALASAFGDDVYGDFLWRTLAEQEGVDLSRSRRLTDWHSPVTVSLAVQRDRAMVTHSHPAPVGPSELLADLPAAAAGVVHLGECAEPWVTEARRSGMLLFGDVGWDPSQQWSGRVLDQLADLHAFLPNSVEAMAYTRTDDPRAALIRLADEVPVVVVTCGGQGAIGIDSISGEEEWVPSLPVNAVDATGAGDVFAAAFVLGSLHDWPLRNRMAFANLCAALSVQQVGGSLAAPGWGDLADWLAETSRRAEAGSRAAAVLRHSYEFLAEVLPAVPAPSVRRARATIARFSDA